MNTILLQITSGNGPEECARMVALTAAEIEHEALQMGISCAIAEALPSRIAGNYHSICLLIDGNASNAFAASWEGSVQWIWQSSYRPGHKRKNWYVKVSRFALDAGQHYDIANVKVESMRASGPGGQHVNKTSSAVRVTHLPTGKSAYAQDLRSQQQNKKLALAKLALLFEAENKKKAADNKSAKRQNHYTVERGAIAAIRVYDAATLKRKK